MEMISMRRRWRPTLAAVAVALSALALTACGGSSSSSASAVSTASNSDFTSTNKYQALLPPMYKGLFAPPTGPAVKAPSGKRIWVVDAGLASSYGVRTADAVQQAGKKLGWNVNVVDAKFDPNQMLTGFKQAVAAKAQGIIAISVDCPIVTTGAQEAKNAGIPVVGHIGITPQTAGLGPGFKMRTHRDRLIDDARSVEAAGAYAIVLEVVDYEISREITAMLTIPTIGIGSGPHCDSQVLVLHDILGMYANSPSFAKRYAEFGILATQALQTYAQEVRERTFPG